MAIVNSKSFTSEKLSSLRCSILAGSPVAQAQVHHLIQVLPYNHFMNAYGLSELAPISMTSYGIRKNILKIP